MHWNAAMFVLGNGSLSWIITYTEITVVMGWVKSKSIQNMTFLQNA